MSTPGALACLIGLGLTKLACSDDDTRPLGTGGVAAAAGTGGSKGGSVPAVAGDGSGGSEASEGEAGAPSLAGTAGKGGSAAGGSSGSANGGSGGNPNEEWILPPGATLASCIPANWSVSAAFTAEGSSANYAVDGLSSTRWSNGTAQSPGEYYEISFGGWVTISQVVLNSAGSAGDYPRGYEVRASKDGVTFAKVLASEEVALPPEGDVLTIDVPPTPMQALRIAATVSTGNWWSIHELSLECLGSDDGTPPVDPLLCDAGGSDAGAGGAGAGGEASSGGSGGVGGSDGADAFDPQNWTATASATQQGGSTDAAFDGALGTRWSSGKPQTGDDWYQLDLGSVACISSLWIVSAGGDFAKAFAIDVSVDGVLYVPVSKGDGAAVSHLEFAPHLARFVRIKQVGNGGANWWSIQEIEVHP